MFDLLIFVLFCCITIIIQCSILRKFIVTKDERFSYYCISIFLGIILSGIIGAFLCSLFDEDCSSFGEWGFLYYIFGIGITIIISFIIIIVDFIVIMKIKNNDNFIKANNLCKRKMLINTNAIVIISFILTLIIPYQINLYNFKKLETYAKEYLENYLNDEYGEENYKIIGFGRSYSYNGIISRSFSGFQARIHINNISDYTKGMPDYKKESFEKNSLFCVFMVGENKNTLRISSDELADNH